MNNVDQLYDNVKREMVQLENVVVLSLLRMSEDKALFMTLTPTQITTDPEYTFSQFGTYSAKRLTPVEISMLKITELAFLYKNKMYIADVRFFKSCPDAIGMSKKALDSHWIRNLDIARMFSTIQEAYITTRHPEGANAEFIVGLHMSALDGSRFKASDVITKVLEDMHAEVVSTTMPDETTAEIIAVTDKEKNGWQQAIAITDSLIGRESIYFYAAWKKGDDVIFGSKITRSHRSQINISNIKADVKTLLETEYAKAKFNGSPKEIMKFLQKINAIGDKDRKKATIHVCNYPITDAYQAFASFKSGTRSSDLKYRIGLGQCVTNDFDGGEELC